MVTSVTWTTRRDGPPSGRACGSARSSAPGRPSRPPRCACSPSAATRRRRSPTSPPPRTCPPRTFFSYFPSKEDVVFAEIDDRLAEVSERLRRTSGEAPMETIRRSIVDVLEAVVAEHRDYGAVQVALVLERPGLRARALQRLLDAQEAIEALLRELCPGISEIDAVAASGIAVGGMQAVVAHCRREGYDPVSMRTALDRAVDLVENGLVSVDALSRPSP
ncbi:TetR/AcrR family transcriptional regulator [Actinomadura madurae]|nr:TetR/AcrR family transcriptional regulator [Actinomadura madurae]MCP9950745.1 TetR/AcrR family transcriptional regulator [Actinomadura madurae]